jgi:Tfp pilus assembly protein PilN
MDCIDHSTSTTRLLQMLEAYGFLRWHQVSEIDVRNWAFVFPAHYSAVIEEKASAARFVVDSWFVDNGQPAVILPLGEWKKGAGPDV